VTHIRGLSNRGVVAVDGKQRYMIEWQGSSERVGDLRVLSMSMTSTPDRRPCQTVLLYGPIMLQDHRLLYGLSGCNA
jgi:hypothetical protein